MMPQLGEIKTGGEIGKSPWQPSIKFIWSGCNICGKERWVQLKKGKPAHTRCQHCCGTQMRKGYIGSLAPSWKGGKFKNKAGYVFVWLSPDDFFYSMARFRGTAGYILEHRLTMARALKRCLLPWEVVHHKNGIKDDNRLENLILLPKQSDHLVDSSLKAYIKKLERHINKLQFENKELKERLNE